MKHSKIGMSLALVFSALAVSSASAQVSNQNWENGSNIEWRSTSGECVQGGHWTPDSASPRCVTRVAPVVQPTNDPDPVPVTRTYSEDVKFDANTLFAFDSAALKPEGKAAIDTVVSKVMNSATSVSLITIVGHTDSVGTKQYNQGLSERRAAAVKQYMVSKGVPAELIKSEGRNFSEPIADNRTREGRALNRRVVIEIFGNQTR